MQSDHRFHLRNAVACQNQVGDGSMDFPPPTFPSVLPYAPSDLMPIHGVELQPSEVCPKNFIIFDQNDYRSQIMFHPAMAHKFAGAGMHIGTSYIEETCERKTASMMHGDGSYLNGDSDDIDALLSLEEDEQEEYEEEEVSTARTYRDNRSNPSDSCSIYGGQPDNSSSSPESCPHGGSKTARKQQKMKKMVKALKGIVPGGEHMSTATVIDEAVKYLKSLKVEAKKLGVKNFKN